jgi:hypothetical protein
MTNNDTLICWWSTTPARTYVRPAGPGLPAGSVESCPPLARSSSIPVDSPSRPGSSVFGARWPHSESAGLGAPRHGRRRTGVGCSRWVPLVFAPGPWPGPAHRADVWSPPGGRVRSESGLAPCAILVWALSIQLIDLPSSPFSHWPHVAIKHRRSLVMTGHALRHSMTGGVSCH